MMKSGTVKVAAVMSLMLAGISVAAAQSGGSGASGSAGATIDTGAGGALAGAGAGPNPGISIISGSFLPGPMGLVIEVFLNGENEKSGADLS
ncbi:hypothetical protein [Hydrocarboniphaga effusa]|uniref:hypothetical protein n=1 Tax=Hydrocarboniphaga effusa TaxID=243629 RepID=UPI003137A00D